MMKSKFARMAMLMVSQMFVLALAACGQTPAADAPQDNRGAAVPLTAPADDSGGGVISHSYLPYNWQLWDGTYFDFATTTKVDEGYKQDEVKIGYYPNSLVAVDAKHATIILNASGGLTENYQHDNNLGLAPYAFAWSTSPTALTDEPIAFEGYQFAALTWMMAGEVYEGRTITSDVLDVNEAIDKIVSSRDLNDDGEEDTEREKAIKAYMETQRLQLGETYYFYVRRYGGNALFATSGFHSGDLNADGERTAPTNFVNSEIVMSVPVTMPAE